MALGGDDKDRQKWAIRMQNEWAVDIYNRFWDECEVVHNDEKGQEEDVAKYLDYGDIDKIIQIPKQGYNIFMAQRFRTLRNDTEELADFSLRDHPHSDRGPTEYDRFLNAYENDEANYPSRYAFGRTSVQSKGKSKKVGFEDFYIIDTEKMLIGLENGVVDITDPIPNYDERDTYARYITIGDLWDAEAIVKDWPDDGEGAELDEKPDNPSDITQWVATND